MFNVNTIQTNLYKVVGFRQPYNPSYTVLDTDNTTSRSGYYATDNPLCKIEYIKDSQDYSDISDADFNTILKQMQETSIASVAGLVFNESDFIDRQVLYPWAQNKVDTETQPAGLITHKIQVSDAKNIAFEITRVLLDFDGSGDIKLMLFNTAEENPIQTETVTISSKHQEVKLNWVVDNSGDTYKGDYYIGYRTNDPAYGTLAPFKRDYENSDIEADITYLNVERQQFVGHSTDTLPDLDTEDSYDEASGLNLDITVYEDFTDLIVQNERLFARAIVTDLQIQCLTTSIASLRSNRNQRISQEIGNRILAEIDGLEVEDGVTITGLRPQLTREISNIRKEIKRLKDGYQGDYAKISTLI